MILHETIGWVGAFLFAFCAVPQVLKTWRTKRAGDLSLIFLLFWFFGEIFTIVYVGVSDLKNGTLHLPLYANYISNAVLVLYLIYAKLKYAN